MNATVVVGVDGSDCSLVAVDLAAQEATMRGLPLRVVHAFVWPLMGVPLGPSPSGPPEGGLQHEAERILAAAVARARAAAPDVPVEGEMMTGGPAAVLVHASAGAAVTVVGDRGMGGFAGLLVGSVAVQLVAHARGPVLVARGRQAPSGDVLLGVDGSPLGKGAVAAAFEEASLRGAGLTAVHAWRDAVARRPGDMLPLVEDLDAIEGEEARVLSEALGGMRERYPEVTVREHLVRGRIRRSLLDLSGSAQLLVVGARGRGGLAGLLLGSVSQASLHHADCPVLVVPAPGTREP